MKNGVLLVALSMLVSGRIASADDAQPAAVPVKETFVLQGLHCPPCTSTVERSLARIKGVQSAKVDWKTKNAWVTLDESVVSVQQVAQAVAATPHMMGRGMKYKATFALSVPTLTDEAAAEKVKAALAALPAVANVYAYPQSKAVTIEFRNEGNATSADLVTALKAAGFEAAPF